MGVAAGLAVATAVSVAIGNELLKLSDQSGLFGGAQGRANRGHWVDEHIPGMKWLRDQGRKWGLEPATPPPTNTGKQSNVKPLSRKGQAPNITVKIGNDELAKILGATIDEAMARNG
jgi:hypothetical protein